MSKTVDERVVSMQFDNEHFERNVKTTMSTLDRLKQSLNLSGSAKGLENIGTAAKNVNMSSLGNAVETVRTKFSALEVMGVTALANITNSAVNAGKRIVKSLTIAPIKSGFDEYELKMGSIQTIMAGTGESLETVNKYLDELNTYSDQTIYSFQDMTSNIGKFTNAGVKLEDAVMAIKGISNEAAVSGANANEASRAMYNFAQALSAGYVKLIDWKSIELANMATVEFKNQLIASAVAAGTLKDAGDGMYETLEGKLVNATTGFNDSLQDQWMTTEVLISTLKDYADENTDIGKKAKAAATEVKTFSMMMDTFKESIQSGWARTWEILVGDFEQAKSMWTSVSNALGGVVEKISGARNDLLEKVFGERDTSSWEKLTSKITEAGGSVEDFEKSVKKVAKKHGVAIDDMIKEEGSFNKTLKKGWLTKDIYTQALDDYAKSMEGVSGATGDANESLAYFQKMFDEVWRGNWDNGRKRIELLTEAGHDYAAIQKLVNEHTAGSTLTMEDLSDAQLKNMGLTKDQIDLFRELADQAKESGSTIEEEINNLSKRSGRDLMIEAIKNFVKEFGKIGTAIKEGWTNAFGDIDIADGIYGAIEALHDLSENFTISEENAGHFKTIVQGALAGFNLTFGVFGKGVVFSLKLLSAVLEVCGTDLLELGDTVASYIINLKGWVYEHTLVGNSLNKLAKIIVAVANGMVGILDAILSLDMAEGLLSRFGKVLENVFGGLDLKFKDFNVDEFIANMGTVFESIQNWIRGLKESETVTTILDGLFSGLEFVLKFLVGLGPKIVDAISSIVDAVKTVWSYLTGTFDEGAEFLSSWFKGGGTWDTLMNFDSFKNLARIGKILEPIKKVFEDIKLMFSWIKGGGNWDTLMNSGSIADLPKNIAEAIFNAFTGLIGFVTDVFSELWSIVTGGSEKISDGLISGLVINIWNGIALVGKVLIELAGIIIEKVCDVLGIHSPSRVFMTIGTMIILGLVLGLKTGSEGLSTTFGEIFGGIIQTIKTSGMYEAVKTYGGKILEFLGSISFSDIFTIGALGGILYFAKKLKDALEIIAGGIKSFNGLVDSVKGIVKTIKETIAKLGKAASMFLYAKAAKELAIGIGILAGAIAALALIAHYDSASLWTAVGAVAALAAIMGALFFVVRKVSDGKNPLTDKGTIIDFGKMSLGILSIASAIMTMALAAKMLSKMSYGEFLQAVGGITILAGAMIGLMWATKLIVKTGKGNLSESVTKIGSMLLSMAGAMIVMSIAAKLLAGIDPENFTRAMIGMVAMAGIMAGLVWATKLIAKTEKGNISTGLEHIGKMLKSVAGAFIIMSASALILGNMKYEKLVQAGNAITQLAIIMVGLMLATQLIAKTDKGNASSAVSKIGSTLLAVTGAFMFLTAAAVVLGNMKYEKLVQAGNAITQLSIIIVGLMLATRLIDNGKGLTGLGSTILAIASAMTAVAIAAAIMGNIPAEDFKQAITGIIALVSSIIVLAAVTNYVGGNDLTKIGSTIMMMAVGITILAAAALVLAFVPASDLYKAANAILGLSVCMALLMVASSKMQKSLPQLIAMTAMIGVLATALVVLTKTVDSKDLLRTSLSLGLALLALGGALALIGTIGGGTSMLMVAASLAIVSASVAVLAASLWLLAEIPFEQMGKSLLILVGGLAAFVIAMFAMNTLAVGAVVTAGVLLSFAAVLVAFGAAALGVAGSVYILGLALPLLATGIQTLMEKTKGYGENALEVFKVMLSVAGGIAAISIATALAGPALALLGIGLAVVGVALVVVGIAALAFAGALRLAGAALPLVGTGLEALVTSVSNCAGSMESFKSVMGTIVDSASALLTTLAIGSVALGGGLLVLSIGLIAVGASGVIAAVGIVALAAAIGLLGLIVLGIVDLMFSLGTTISETAKTLGSDLVNGFAEGIVNTLGAIIDAVGSLVTTVIDGICNLLGIESPSKVARVIGGYISEGLALGIGDGEGVVEESATNLANTAKESMGTAADEGGTSFVDTLKNSISGTDLESSIDTSSLTSILGASGTEGGNALMTGLKDSLDFSSLGVGGENGLDMSSLKSMFNTSGTENGIAYTDGLNSSMNGASMDSTLTSMLTEISDRDADFSQAGADLISAFADGVTGSTQIAVDAVSSVMENSISSFKQPSSDAMASFISGIKGAYTDVSSTMDLLISDMIGVFNKNSSRFKVEGSNVVTNITAGINKVKAFVSTDLRGVLSLALNSIRSSYDEFKNAGGYLVDGFARGISANTYKAEAKARTMAQLALQAAQQTLGIKSPSKEFYKIGEFTVEGFVNALGDYSSKVYSASSEIASDAKSGISDAIAKISNAINSDIDSQPTIRPVLDLSDIKSGASSIDSLFGTNPSIGVLANVNGISSMMNQRNQNGTNSDIISAINRLEDKLSNAAGDTYQINGITYDDGSNVSDAVRTLVRAAKVERRI